MNFNIDKIRKCFAKDTDRSNWGLDTVYHALNFGGITYTSLYSTSDCVEMTWNKNSSLEEFVRFWGRVLGTPYVSIDSSRKVLSPSINIGDIIVERTNRDYSNIVFVSEIVVRNNAPHIYDVYRFTSQDGLLERLKLTCNDFHDNSILLPFSNISHNLSSYYNLIFKAFFKNQTLFTRLILACCPETQNINGNGRLNSYPSLFSKISCAELQETITKIVNCEDGYELSLCNDSMAQLFVKTIYINPKTEGRKKDEDAEICIKTNELLNGKSLQIENFSKPIVNNMLHGKPTKYVDDFFSKKANRSLFQERFSLVMQYYLLLSSKNQSVFKHEINRNNPETFNGASSSITEYVTLSSDVFMQINHIIRYLTNDTSDLGIYVDSLYSLAGCLFDSIGLTSSISNNRIFEEYQRFTELAKCYGARTLDYYFALLRFKDVNHFAAAELANVYYFGWEFEGYRIEKNTEEAIRLLSSCKDFSIEARWSLAENYKRLAERYRMLELKYSSAEMVSSEVVSFINDGSMSEEFCECLRICQIKDDALSEFEVQDLTNRISNKLTKEKAYLLMKGRNLYESCGDYPPALNSMANAIRASLEHLIDGNTITNSEIESSAVEAISYAFRAAVHGWVYAFNNLYSLLNNKMVYEALRKTIRGRKAIDMAFSIFKDTDYLSPDHKDVEQINMIIKSLLLGTEKELISYNGTVYRFKFQFVTPIESPINFLIISAYLDNLYGLNHLGIEYLSSDIPNATDQARILFECAARYGAWGYFNLATRIYQNQDDIQMGFVSIAADMGLQKAIDFKRHKEYESANQFDGTVIPKRDE